MIQRLAQALPLISPIFHHRAKRGSVRWHRLRPATMYCPGRGLGLVDPHSPSAGLSVGGGGPFSEQSHTTGHLPPANRPVSRKGKKLTCVESRNHALTAEWSPPK